MFSCHGIQKFSFAFSIEAIQRPWNCLAFNLVSMSGLSPCSKLSHVTLRRHFVREEGPEDALLVLIDLSGL